MKVLVEAQGQLCLLVPVRVVNLYVQWYKTQLRKLYPRITLDVSLMFVCEGVALSM